MASHWLGATPDDYYHQRPHSSLGQRTPAEVGAAARETMALDSKTIEIINPEASSVAAMSRSKVEVSEDPERLALSRA